MIEITKVFQRGIGIHDRNYSDCTDFIVWIVRHYDYYLFLNNSLGMNHKQLFIPNQ